MHLMSASNYLIVALLVSLILCNCIYLRKNLAYFHLGKKDLFK